MKHQCTSPSLNLGVTLCLLHPTLKHLSLKNNTHPIVNIESNIAAAKVDVDMATTSLLTVVGENSSTGLLTHTTYVS